MDIELFKNPTSEYRAAPFWAWNCKLDKETLSEQIAYFKEMGYGGFHMHSRSGLATTYLGEEFMDCVKHCRDKAKENDMLAWVYDEDRWPSGFAGGYVTKTMKYRQKKLHFTPEKKAFFPEKEGTEKGLPYLIGTYDITLDEKGFLKEYKKIEENAPAVGMKRYAYVEPTAVDEDKDYAGWHNGGTPVDAMNPEAVGKFIDITYEAYKKHVGESFDDTIPAIFTDEPQIGFKQFLPFAASEAAVMTPWTVGFADKYKELYGEDIADTLPEIFLDLPDGKVSVTRYRYHELTCRLFTENTAKQCGTWCQKNGVALTGHMMWEHTLDAQTRAVGEAMRAYEWFDIPGIDLLCDRMEINTAKQCQSAVRQFGKEAMLTELYGVTNWDFDFRGHKFQGDWQAALGATVRVPHLAWMSMKGSSKRDYPASLSYQIPWYKEYAYVEDHYARLATVLSRGKSVVNVGVIHPIESYWLYFGPQDTSSQIKADMERNFAKLSRFLCDGMVDFDYISEAMLPTQRKSVTNVLTVGEMNYSTVIVPACKTLRRTTFEIIKKFSENGGKLIFIGECPRFIDAVETDEIQALYEKSICVDFEKLSILGVLEKEATLKAIKSNGEPATGFVHQLRQDGEALWLFMAHCERSYHKPTIDMAYPEDLMLVFDGKYIPKLYNTIAGTVEDVDFEIKGGKTYVYKTLYAFDSLLLCLEKTEETTLAHGKGAVYEGLSSGNLNYEVLGKAISGRNGNVLKRIDFKKPVEYTRSEDNVLVVDMVEYKLDDENTFSPMEEILRIDEKCRKILGYPKADGRDVQPWVIPDERPSHFITIRYSFIAEDTIENVYIAGEEAVYIRLNGKEISLSPCGYYVDKAIKKYKAGSLVKGENTLEIKAPITKRISLENYFILGDFDVNIRGCEKSVCSPKETIGFSDITSQGMPFYGGNITYHTRIDIPGGTVKIRANRYRGAMIKVSLDGEEVGNIVYPPYVLEIQGVSEGEHTLEFTLFGNRVNTFGPLHDSSGETYIDPGVWYTRDYAMSYEYEPKQTGILSSPIIEILE